MLLDAGGLVRGVGSIWEGAGVGGRRGRGTGGGLMDGWILRGGGKRGRGEEEVVCLKI